MQKRSVALVLGILLLSYSPLSHETHSGEETILRDSSQRVEISPDPNSIQNLGTPIITDGFEDIRANRADSSIGVYTQCGLLPNNEMSAEMASPRSDLAIAIVDGEVGLWDARIAILETYDVEIRSTIPPSGFLIQGQPEIISALSALPEVLVVHQVAMGLLAHPELRMNTNQGEIIGEVIGSKNSD